MTNQIVELLLQHRSIRKYQDKEVPVDIIETIVRAGQQAAFAYQAYSVLLSRNKKKHPFGAPLYFIPCVDLHKIELIMKKREWKFRMCDISALLLSLQDAAYMAQNLVIAAESYELGTCYIGSVPYHADKVAERFDLPEKIFPLVGITVGYPAENPPTRPRYPMKFTLFENNYPKIEDKEISKAMDVMDEGYLAQDYYKNAGYMIKLTEKDEETFDFKTYSWTEHISRKLGQWEQNSKTLFEQFRKRGFDLTEIREDLDKTHKE